MDVAVPGTDRRESLVISQGDAVDTATDPAAMARRRAILDALKVHPREQAENAALLARANRCYEEHLGEVRQNIGQWIGTFEQILEQQNPREIKEARTQLQQLLDRVDGETFL